MIQEFRFQNLASDRFKDFLICIEDKRFYNHFGIDFKGMVRAICVNLRHRRVLQGGSTITQQLARCLLKNNQKTLSRKLKEIRLALHLEQVYSKKEILDLFLKSVYWGGSIYGLTNAVHKYLRTEVDAITIEESILLLGLLRGPNLYLKNNNLLVDRCKLLSRILYKNGVITQEEISNFEFEKYLNIQ